MGKALLYFQLLGLLSCTETPQFESSSESVQPGSQVSLSGKKIKLYNEMGNIAVGKPIHSFVKDIADPEVFKGKVSLINIVPSIDTPVCEGQTHILGEDKRITQDIFRVTISRDLPMAQNRFAKAAKLTNITYLSDFKNADFGKNSGLLMTEKGLLARAVLVTDRDGIIRYLQVVPDVTKLPDMDRAIEMANSLSKK